MNSDFIVAAVIAGGFFVALAATFLFDCVAVRLHDRRSHRVLKCEIVFMEGE